MASENSPANPARMRLRARSMRLMPSTCGQPRKERIYFGGLFVWPCFQRESRDGFGGLCLSPTSGGTL